jgi:hypothetical protein
MPHTLRRTAYVLAVALWAVVGFSATLTGCTLMDNLANTGAEDRAHERRQDEQQTSTSVGQYVGYAIDGLILTAMGGGIAYHRRRMNQRTPGQPTPTGAPSHEPTPSPRPSP